MIRKDSVDTCLFRGKGVSFNVEYAATAHLEESSDGSPKMHLSWYALQVGPLDPFTACFSIR